MIRPAISYASYVARRERIAQALQDRGLDAALVTGATDLRWATGFAGSAGALLVAGDGSCTFATDARYAEAAAAALPEADMLDSREPWLDLVAHVMDRGSVRVAVDADDLTWSQGRVLNDRFAPEQVADSGSLVADLRATKDPYELAVMREACRITEEAVLALSAEVEVGQSERDIARQFLRLIDDLGADGPAFAPIVAAGPNAAIPHHEPGARQLAWGDLLILDVGAQVEGYCSDLSRTFAVGHVAPALRAMHEVVERAQAAARDAVRPEATAGSIDAAARQVIQAAGYGEHFVHGTGHGVGLDIHEPPILRAGAAGILGESFVVTVEPGIYVSGVGGVRIEDTVIVGAEGAEPLTRLPRGLIVL